MDLYKSKIKVYSILLGILISPIFAQQIEKLENNLILINNSINKNQIIADSLKGKLNNLLQIVEKEKNRKSINRDYISKLLNDALILGTKIDNLETNISVKNVELTKLKRKLYTEYSNKIDALEKAISINDENRLNEIKIYNAKKLSVSPVVNMFTFNPALIGKINFYPNQTAEEKDIYKSYLINSLGEVDSVISVIVQREKDIIQVMRLNELAEDYIDEMDNMAIRTGSFIAEGASGSASSYNTSPVEDNAGNFGESAISKSGGVDTRIIFDINQTLRPFINDGTGINNISNPDSIHSEEYINLLAETAKTLRLYKELISDILKKENP